MANDKENRLTDLDDQSGMSIDLFELWAMTWRRKWCLIGFVLVSLSLGAAYTFIAEPIYEVRARLLVEQQGLPLERTPATRQDDDFLATQAEIIRSPTVIERAADSLGLIASSQTRTESVMAILDALTVSPLIGTNVLSLNYRSTDQRQAVRIVEVVIASFREYLRDNERDTHLESLRVLTRSERELREDLKMLEEEFIELRLKSPFVGLGKETPAVRMNLLEHLGRTLSETKNRRIQLESSLQSLANIYSNGAVAETPSRSIGRSADDSSASVLYSPTDVMPVALVSASTHSQAADLQSLNEIVVLSALSIAQGSLAAETAVTRRELLTARLHEKDLASRFGHKHPEIKAIREQIAILKSRLSETIRAAPAILDHELGSVKRDEKRLGELYAYELEEAKIVDAYLVREQQAQAAIQRVQTIHDSLLTQLRQWQLSDDAVVGGRSGIKVAVLEAPRFTDRAAVWPTSTLVLGLFGMIGLIGGLGMVTVLEHIDYGVPTQL